MGDASSSMSVAVRTSTIIAGILTAITSAKLSFFNGSHREPEKVPATVEEVGVSQGNIVPRDLSVSFPHLSTNLSVLFVYVIVVSENLIILFLEI